MADKNIHVMYLLNGDAYLLFLKALLSCHPHAYHRNNYLSSFISRHFPDQTERICGSSHSPCLF